MGNAVSEFSVASVFLVLMFLALMPEICAAGSVSRHFSSGSVMPGGQINVTLVISVGPGCKFYIVDEIIPSGWSIIDSGSLVESGKLNASESRHLKIVEISGASGTSYSYRVQAPLSNGAFSFYGIFSTDGMVSSSQITGDSSIHVGTSSGSDGGDTGSSVIGGNAVQACTEGIITLGCICQGVFKEAGYCCDGYYQTADCDAGQGPLPVLEQCVEGESEQCGSNIGACSFGTRSCSDGLWSDCTGGTAPSAEYYDGIDNDCDGETDEDCTDADISRCEGDPSKCLCGSSGKSGTNVQGYIPLSAPPESLIWAVIFISVMTLLTTIGKTISYRRSQGGLPGLPVPMPSMSQGRLDKKDAAFLMALKGIVKD